MRFSSAVVDAAVCLRQVTPAVSVKDCVAECNTVVSTDNKT